jgi:hypothetical protein
MSKRIKPSDYTHSVWSGKKYDRPQTLDELTNEGKAVVAKLLAEIAARRQAAQPIMDAWRRGDQDGIAKAQSAMRAKFA